MTIWVPEWRIKANGDDVTNVTLANLTITAGRTDINGATPPSYCNLQLINTNETTYSFSVNTGITIEVKDSNGDYVPIFGGRISDINQSVYASGQIATVTTINIVAVGALAKLQRAIFDGNLAEGLDGEQILELLDDLLLGAWNEVPPAESWENYLPTEMWEDALNIGLGEIDTGEYTMSSRQISDQVIAQIANEIANSALGYLYEDSQGRIGYADASHRQDYLLANGYIDLDGAHSLSAGVGIVQRQGDIANRVVIDYGNNFGSQYVAEDTTSQSTYGLFAEQLQSYVKNASDIEDIADRVIQLRAYPRYYFQRITFPLHSPEIDDTDRDSLLNVFMGMPIRINNLPPQMLGGEFTGFLEGWTFNASVQGLSITLNASPTEFSTIAQRWNQVDGAETWNTVLNTLEWQEAIGVIS